MERQVQRKAGEGSQRSDGLHLPGEDQEGLRHRRSHGISERHARDGRDGWDGCVCVCMTLSFFVACLGITSRLPRFRVTSSQTQTVIQVSCSLYRLQYTVVYFQPPSMWAASQL